MRRQRNKLRRVGRRVLRQIWLILRAEWVTWHVTDEEMEAKLNQILTYRRLKDLD